ncbi:MAG: hypothetical protein PHH83_04925, partial [Patescibacteria group bacterium]|nr:hypothetical protein [Patescibacteria group bacterium]
MFDVWTIGHLLGGLSIGKLIDIVRQYIGLKENNGSKNVSQWFNICIVLFFSYLWEAIEHYFETGLIGDMSRNWFQGVEFWANRLVADPLIIVLSYIISIKYPKIVWPARFLFVLWWIVHLFIFPNSMYLQLN